MAKAANTLRAYRADWQAFCDWTRRHHLSALPAAPHTLAMYVTHLAGAAKASTVARRLAAIAHAHRERGIPSPTEDAAVRAAWAEIRRAAESAAEKARPIGVPLLRGMVESAPLGLGGIRDRALLLLGYAAALRRSELVALDAADLSRAPEGLVVLLRRPEVDGRAAALAIPEGGDEATCPVRAVRRWREGAGITSGALFRPVSRAGRVGSGPLNPVAVSRIVRKAVAAAGLDPSGYSAHSLRAGFAAAAAGAGVPEPDVSRHLRGTPVQGEGSIDAGLFLRSPVAALGL